MYRYVTMRAVVMNVELRFHNAQGHSTAEAATTLSRLAVKLQFLPVRGATTVWTAEGRMSAANQALQADGSSWASSQRGPNAEGGQPSLWWQEVMGHGIVTLAYHII